MYNGAEWAAEMCVRHMKNPYEKLMALLGQLQIPPVHWPLFYCLCNVV